MFFRWLSAAQFTSSDSSNNVATTSITANLSPPGSPIPEKYCRPIQTISDINVVVSSEKTHLRPDLIPFTSSHHHQEQRLRESLPSITMKETLPATAKDYLHSLLRGSNLVQQKTPTKTNSLPASINKDSHPDEKARYDSPSNQGSSGKERDADGLDVMDSLDSSLASSRSSLNEDVEANASSETMPFNTHDFDSALFNDIQSGDRSSVRARLAKPSSAILQRLLTFSYPNRITHPTVAGSSTSSPQVVKSKMASPAGMKKSPSALSVTRTATPTQPHFDFDQEVLAEAHELLGTSVQPLNYVQIACMLGEEEVASDIVRYVYQCTANKHKKLLLMEFLGKTFGDGNTILHLASFQGMSELVKLLLDCGANPNKRNGRGYKVSLLSQCHIFILNECSLWTAQMMTRRGIFSEVSAQ